MVILVLMLGTANKLKTARQIALTGAVSGSTNFDGSGNVNINTIINKEQWTVSNSNNGNSVTINFYREGNIVIGQIEISAKSGTFLVTASNTKNNPTVLTRFNGFGTNAISVSNFGGYLRNDGGIAITGKNNENEQASLFGTVIYHL